MDKTRAQEICRDIAKDMENDATAFDGKPFTGRTVAEYFGNHGAAIAALAGIVAKLCAEDKDTFEVDVDGMVTPPLP